MSPSPQRVCSVTHLDVSAVNGPTKHMLGIATGFSRLDVDVELLASASGRRPDFGGTLTALADAQPRTPADHLRYQLRVLTHLWRRRGQYDWIYVRAGSFMLSPLYAWLARAPVATEINGLPYLEGRFPKALEQLIRRLFAWQVRRAALCAVVSAELRQLVTALGQPRVLQVINGVGDDDLPPTPTRRPAPSGPHRLVFIGALHAWQGVDLAIEAVHLATQRGAAVHLKVLGDGPERAALQARVEDLGLGEHVELCGHVGRAEVHAALRDAHVALAPFVPNERNLMVGFSPLKIYEYLAFDLPVITTPLFKDPELMDVLGDFVTIVPATSEALAQAIEERAARPLPAPLARDWIATHRTWDRAALHTAAAMQLTPPTREVSA
ncbi:glycosyltransferase involved in cell wall biosynthesis [Deinococcus metalli]|uniref:Glycosyltransferase involved in cell wall biosynthesis n=1 Tax=Deinococcus metalli TaxID=1141878 RepID=A0A7W8NN88_9DEIO|nr:glycosyltransferase family 4 protein [Deinococcus metalli]MBB5376639.1 glycosyltransferase involved in cell wall biosynthesis [Deinococcus metalli]GHF42590.1 hypothetical protein GCM10017781_18630 [Deinococcus metalli]